MKWLAHISVFSFLMLSGAPVYATTWHLESDGSGDFPTLQAAVDAAADGDVIMLGAGRFDDFVTDDQWGDFRVWTHGDKSLTFIGAGPEDTIIGPDEYEGLYRGWGIYCEPGPVIIRIEGIRFEHLDRAGILLYCDYVQIFNCVFDKCYDSIMSVGGESTTINNCQFFDSFEPFTQAMLCRTRHVNIADALVQNCRSGVLCDFSGTNDILITDCTFDGMQVGFSGVEFNRCGGSVTNCQFVDLVAVGFGCTHGKDIILSNNDFIRIIGTESFGGKAISLFAGDSFTATGNIISSSNVCFDLQNPFENFEARNNHIFRNESSDGYFIKTNFDWTFYDYHWNFSNNYWGTTDVDEISQWIFDGYDSDDVTMFVDYLPLADGPVLTESVTLDALKAMFR